MDPTFIRLLYLVPAVVLSLVGIVAAITHLKRHPVPSSLILAACVLALIQAIGIPLLRWVTNGVGLMTNARLEENARRETMILIFGAINYSVEFALLLLAAFAGRRDLSDSNAQQRPRSDSKPIVMAEMGSGDSQR